MDAAPALPHPKVLVAVRAGLNVVTVRAGVNVVAVWEGRVVEEVCRD